MLIYFRLSSEHAGAYRECPIATSTITVGELKQLLARRCGFAAEFKRKIDFKIFLVSNNGAKTEGEGAEDLVEVENEDQQVQGFSRVVLQRTIVRGQACQDVLQHNARTQLTADEWANAEGRQGHGKKRRLPPEWICGICRGLMRQPLLVKCASNCGHSACRSCIETRLKQQHACPFCRSSFRQVIRNKRLEEILKNVNPDEYEQPVGAAGGLQSVGPSGSSDAAPAGATQAHPNESDGTLFPATGIRQGPSPASTVVAVKDEASDAMLNGSGVVGARVGRTTTKGPYPPPPEAGVGPRHFVYLQPPKNLQLMRHFDMMVVDAASELAAALANACMREAESAAAVAGAAEASRQGDSSNSAPLQEEFYLVPCCLCGGGSSFSIGGFVRLRADNRVPPTDRVASDLLSQWQLQGPPQGPSASHTYADATRGVPSAVRTPAYVLRVNWIEKYGRMPMLPARKQPLCGLFGGPRRGPLGIGGAPNTGTSQGAGLLRRTTLGPSVEVAVDESKYDEVTSCVRDYVQYGSRSSDPWRQGGPPALSSVQAGLGAPGTAPAAADPHSATARNSPPSSNASVVGSLQAAGEAPPLSVASLLSLASVQVSARRQQQQPQQQNGGTEAPASAGGPKPLSLPGKTLNPSNPFLGYTAILPFLSEEQFNHVRRLQLKALKRAGIVPKGGRLEGLRGSSICSSKRNSPHDSDGRSSCGEHDTPNPSAATATAAPPAVQDKPGPAAVAGAAPGATAREGATAPPPRAAPAVTATGARGPPCSISSGGRSGLAPSVAAPQRPPVVPKRAAGLPGRRAPVVVPPPLKRLRVAVGQGATGVPATHSSETRGSGKAPAQQPEACSESAGLPVSPIAPTTRPPLLFEGDAVAGAQKLVGCTDAPAPPANGNSSGETVDADSSASDSLAWSCAVETLHSDPEGGAAITTPMQAAEARQ